MGCSERHGGSGKINARNEARAETVRCGQAVSKDARRQMRDARSQMPGCREGCNDAKRDRPV